MPAWSWLVIWVLLAVGLLTMLVWFAIVLFRKAMAVLAALEELGDQLATLDLDAEVPRRRLHPAIFQNRHELALAIDQTRILRAHRRAARRDLSISRGKLLQHSPYKPEDRPSC
jgi:hypothetical protein